MQGSSPVQLNNGRWSDRIRARWKSSSILDPLKKFEKPGVIEEKNVGRKEINETPLDVL
jgi:hypothetical protein